MLVIYQQQNPWVFQKENAYLNRITDGLRRKTQKQQLRSCQPLYTYVAYSLRIDMMLDL